MTLNLLAILLSFALALTGAPTDGALSEPVGRVATVENIVLTHNEEEVALAPRAVFGVSTDGAQAVYDFYIDLNGDRLLPFQAVVDDKALALINDSTGATLKLTAEDINALMESAQALVGMPDMEEGMDDETREIMSIMTNDLVPAYQQMLLTLTDREQVAAFQAAGDALYAELIDRGAGEAETIEYQGEEIPVTVYRYALDGAQMGALCDAVLASNPATKAYVEAYFKLLAALPAEDMGPFAGATNYETLLADVDMRMEMTESVAESGLNVTDGKLILGVPGLETPLVMNIYGVKDGDYKTADVTFEQTFDGVPVDMRMESTQDGDDIYFNMTFSALDPDSMMGGSAPTAAVQRDPALIDAMVAEILEGIAENDDPITAIDKAATRVEGSGLPADEVIQAVVDALNLEGVTVERTTGVGAIADVTVTIAGVDDGAVFYIMENAGGEAPEAAEAVDPAVAEMVEAILAEVTESDTALTVIKKTVARAEAEGLSSEAVLEGVLNALGLVDEEESSVMFYFSMNGYCETKGENTDYGFGYNVAQEDMGFNAGVGFGGTTHGDGTSQNYLFASCMVGEDFYGFSCDINVENTPIAPRVDADSAQSLDEFDATQLYAGLGLDALRLINDASVKDAMKLFHNASAPVADVAPAADTAPSAETAPIAPDVPVAPPSDGAGAREAEPYDDGAVSYGVPQFTWLPDGYHIDAVDVDTQYDTVDYTLSNPETGDELYAFFSASYYSGAVAQYLVDEDGNVTAIDPAAQPIITGENDGGFRRFTLDDGKIALSVYPYSDALSDMDVARIIAGIKY